MSGKAFLCCLLWTSKIRGTMELHVAFDIFTHLNWSVALWLNMRNSAAFTLHWVTAMIAKWLRHATLNAEDHSSHQDQVTPRPSHTMYQWLRRLYSSGYPATGQVCGVSARPGWPSFSTPWLNCEWESKFDLWLLIQCGGTYNCVRISDPGVSRMWLRCEWRSKFNLGMTALTIVYADQILRCIMSDAGAFRYQPTNKQITEWLCKKKKKEEEEDSPLSSGKKKAYCKLFR